MTTRSATRRKPSIVTHLTLMLIQPTTAPDLAPITEIYRHHVLHGSGSFETVPPDVAEMQQRWQNVTAQGMPHLVLRQGDRVLGYAYAQPFRPRQAYRHTLEDSIYLHPEALGHGWGKVLLADKVLCVARDAGPEAFQNSDWAQAFAQATVTALGRAVVRIDVASMTVAY